MESLMATLSLLVEWKHLSLVQRKGRESSLSPGNGWGLSPINITEGIMAIAR